MRRAVILASIAVAASGQSSSTFAALGAHMPDAGVAQERDPDAPDILVTSLRDIVVNGRATRCRRRVGDPLDKIDVRSPFASTQRIAVVPAGNGRFAAEPNAEQITGPEFWQRVGVGIDQYVFRASSDDRPMCIGANMADAGTYAGYRRIVDAAPFLGKRVRFTAWVATGQARLVHFWLAAGTEERVLYNGGNTRNRPWGGNHGWTPVFLETGPIDAKAAHISYGFDLQGSGDVWVYKPRFEVATDQPFGPVKGDIVIIGGERQ